MSVVITREDIMAYAEVDYIIHHMNEKYIKKIPEKLLNFFASIKDPNHEVYVNPRMPLQNQNLMTYTLEIIALLHIKYWCEDEERRKMLYEKMIENQRKLDSQMREKYNIDNMFDMNSAKVVSSAEDLEDDYSKPKSITRYSVIAEENPDIADYTDVQDDKLGNYLNKDSSYDIVKESNSENSMVTKPNFIVSFINKIKNIFVRK